MRHCTEGGVVSARDPLPVLEQRQHVRHRLWFAFGITFSVLILEIVGGLVTNSLALFADAGHVVADVGAIGLALGALWLAERPGEARRTYGWHRVEVLAALGNGLGLFIVAAIIVWQAVERAGSAPEINGVGLFAIAGVGLAGNLASAAALHDSHTVNLNVRGAYLHVLGDAVGSVGALTAGAVIWTTGWDPVDVVASVMIAVLVGFAGLRLVRETIDILLESAPRDVDLAAITEELTDVQGVLGIHDLHLWTVTSGFLALSGHIEIADEADSQGVLIPVAQILQSRFGIQHITLQPETASLHEIIGCCEFLDEQRALPHEHEASTS